MNIKDLEITETKPVWVVTSSTDLTEGRGPHYVKCVCETKTTAIRLGKGGYVQGSNCPISEDVAIKVNGKWYFPNTLKMSTDDDKKAQKKLDEAIATKEKLNALGLNDAEIKNLLDNFTAVK